MRLAAAAALATVALGACGGCAATSYSSAYSSPVTVDYGSSGYLSACRTDLMKPSSGGVSGLTAAMAAVFCVCLQSEAGATGLRSQSENSISVDQDRDLLYSCARRIRAANGSAGA